jgi:hypothetical protein
MKIIHLSGTSCSGKSHILQPFLQRDDVAFWDILDFYNREGCIVNGRMDWDKWDKAKPKIIPDLEAWFIKNFATHHCIIESGTNASVNSYLARVAKKYEVIHIRLVTPSDKILVERAKLRDMDPKLVLNFKHMYKQRHEHSSDKTYTQEEASKILAELLPEGESNVSPQPVLSPEGGNQD